MTHAGFDLAFQPKMKISTKIHILSSFPFISECERKKMTYEDRKTRERRKRQKFSQLITFGRRLKKKCDERKADASVVMTMRKMKDGADRDRALCASSIAANVQFLTTRACLSLFNLPPSLGLPLALN